MATAPPSAAATHDHSYTTEVMLDTTAGQEENAAEDANLTIGPEDVTIGVVKASIVGIRVRLLQIGRNSKI